MTPIPEIPNHIEASYLDPDFDQWEDTTEEDDE